MSNKVAAEIYRAGYVFLRRFEPVLTTLSVAGLIGIPAQLSERGPVHKLIPSNTSPPNTYSGMYGLNKFPLHTDLAHWRSPPRFILLRCIRSVSDVATNLIDGKLLVQRVGQDVLSRSLVKPRRRVGGEIFLLRLFEPFAEGFGLIRWDEVFIRPASVVGDLGSRLVRTALQDIPTNQSFLSAPGDTLLIDNWRMLHGRSAIPSEFASREIERVYLEALN